MSKVVLFPTSQGYCKSCFYYDEQREICRNEKYNHNIYRVICIDGFCKYRKVKEENV